MPRGTPKATDEKILDELKEMNKNIKEMKEDIKALFISAEDSRKTLDNMWNERRP